MLSIFRTKREEKREKKRKEKERGLKMQGGDFSDLPEGCISKILSFTSPSDACILSLVSLIFKAAADSDAADWRDMVARSIPLLDLNLFGSVKELYFKLCDQPLLIDGGNKTFSLERRSGKKCFVFGARELYITWADTPRYWRWIGLEESRFKDVAELLDVCWLYITGTIDTQTLSPETTYVVYLVIKFTDDAYGLDHPLAEASVKFVGWEGNASGTRIVHLDPEVNDAPGHFPRERGDGWMELEMGEFDSGGGEDGKVEVRLNAIQGGHWKSGLIVEGMEVRPIGN